MTLALFNANDRQSFLDLTEDSAIREAAYPLSEWEKNGGTKIGGGVGDLGAGYPVPYQDDPPEIMTVGDRLLGVLNQPRLPIKQDPNTRASNISAHWNKVEAHPFYTWLKENPYFVKAREKFQVKKKNAKTLSKLHSAFVDFRFVRIIAMVIGLQTLLESLGYRPAHADKKLLLKTKGYVSNLRASLKAGVRLSDWTKQDSLERLLRQLQQEIEKQPRKEKATATSEKRKCLETVALEMLLEFDLVSATILTEFAAMINWYPDNSTIDKIVKNSKEKYRKSLAKALLKTPA
jgi:hypothetical protein